MPQQKYSVSNPRRIMILLSEDIYAEAMTLVPDHFQYFRDIVKAAMHEYFLYPPKKKAPEDKSGALEDSKPVA